MQQGIDSETASFLLSIIGITNTVGRIISGWLSDFPSVDSLLVTNICIFVSGISLFCVPFCFNYATFCVAAGVFGLFSCKLLTQFLSGNVN
jgi:predicted MFS family arabinose efflux permease